MSTQLDPLSLSADLLYAVKTDGDVDWLRTRLASLARSRLERALSTRERRLSFWLNCYNAYGQLLLEDEENRTLLEGSRLDRWRFVARDRIPVAGVWLSLNDVEHGMLRSSKQPWGLGYVPRLFTSSFERQFRLDTCEPRIHFALPRGLEHTPPITVYSPADVDEDLDIAIEWFLEETVHYDSDRAVATIPRLFLRYRGDFGGKRGVLRFLREYGAIPRDATPSIEYEPGSRSPPVDVAARPP